MDRKHKASFLIELGNQEAKIEILEELKSFIVPLQAEELAQLEENILKEGIREELIVWKKDGKLILIDGHNRYAIAQKHHLSYKYLNKTFENIEGVKDWMLANQLGRRNLTNEQQSYYRGLQYKREKQKQGGTGANQYTKQTGQNVPFANSEQTGQNVLTAKRLAKQHKVSDRTIKRDEKFAEIIDRLSNSLIPEIIKLLEKIQSEN